jgi:hypothetical protein
MLYTATAEFPITADYYSTANTNPDPLGTPIWQDTFVKTVQIQVAVDPNRDNLINVYSKEAMALGYILKSFRDPNGNPLFTTAQNDQGIDYSAYLIRSVDPQINVFGYSEGVRYRCVPLNNARR